MRRDRVIASIDKVLAGPFRVELTDPPNDSKHADHLPECPDLELAQRFQRAEVKWLKDWAAR